MEDFELEIEGFTGEEFSDIKRCVETILSVQAGTLPMDRSFGIDYYRVVGYPTNVARNMLSLEIINKVRMYEPRVEVDSVVFKDNAPDGIMIPHIHIKEANG